jgi:hypothetical protein
MLVNEVTTLRRHCEASSITEIEPTDVYGVYDNMDEDPVAEDDEEESWDTLLLDDGDDERIDEDMF